MKFTIYHSILFALVISQTIVVVQPQLLNNVSQVLEGITDLKPPSSANQQPSSSSQPPQTSASPALPSPPPAQTTSSPPTPPPPPETTSIPQAITTSPPVQSVSEKPATPTPAISNSPTTTPVPENSSNAAPTSTTSQGGGKSKSNKETTSTNYIDTSAPSIVNGVSQSSPISKNNSSSSNNSNAGNKTGIIIGAVVGSIFGVALLGGLLTWINRHGGCARRSNKRSTDFEDYGLADTDFPQQHLRSPAMQTATASNSPALGGAIIAPTIPRLNDQGTFYNGNGSEDVYVNNQHQFTTGYSNPMEHQPAMVDYKNGQPMMDYQQQQSYYYQQQPQDAQMGGGGYYDEQVYYNNQPSVAAQGYDTQFNQQQQPYLDQTPYNPHNMAGDHYYKPDQVDLNHYQRM